MKDEVAEAEKYWVENIAITAAQAIAGPHCRSQRMLAELPHEGGWREDKVVELPENQASRHAPSLYLVVGSLARNDHVVDVAFAESRRSDA